MTRAVLWVRVDVGPSVDKQHQAAVTYAAAHSYALTAVAYEGSAVVALVDAGLADVVIVASERKIGDVGEQVTLAGGRLEPIRGGIGFNPVTWRLIVGAYRRGGAVEQIAHLFGVTERDVRAALAGAGIIASSAPSTVGSSLVHRRPVRIGDAS